MQSLIRLILLILFALVLASCSPLVKKEQPAHPNLIEINKDNSLGQTVLARYDGLQGIFVYLKSDGDYSGEIQLRLYDNPIDRELLRDTSISFADISTPGLYNFTFPTINASTNNDYYLNLTVEGPGSIMVGSAPGNAYLSGSIYKNDLPQDSQLTFKIEYELSQAFIGIIKEVFRWLALLASGLFLIATPGWAVLIWLFPPWKSMIWGEKLGLSAGVGIALYAVLFLWLNIIGLYIGPVFVWLIPLIGLIFILSKKLLSLRDRHWNKKNVHSQPNSDQLDGKDFDTTKASWWILKIKIPDLMLILVMGFVILTRFWPIRILDVPMWGDSYQHTMISQLLVDNGGLFRSWQPYAELNTFTYHYGFHSIVSIYHWLTGVDVIQATLWMGQFINVLAIFALYPLVLLIGRNRWAGVIAVLIAGMLSPMPMYYVNWGRYTQLAGQVILPAAIVIIWLNLESNQINWKWNGLIWIIIAGLSLTHYRVLLFIPLFYLAFLLIQLRELNAPTILRRTLIHASGAIILILPWAVRIFEGKLPMIFGQQVSTPAVQISQAVRESNSIGDISFYLPIFLWVLMLISIVWGIWQSNKKSNTFSLWCLLILLAANPNWLRLPGTGVLSNFAIFIAAYIPASVLIGSAAGSLLSRLNIGNIDDLIKSSTPHAANINRSQLIRSYKWQIILAIIVFVCSISFIRIRLSNVQPTTHALSTRPDVRASEWIDDKLPIEAKFLVNSFFAYGNSLIVGADAGWWLPLLANRDTTLPPLTYGSEQSPHPNYVKYINELVTLIKTYGINSPEVITELRNRKISHIYIGQQQGKVNSPSPPLIDVNDLINNQLFKLVYTQDRIRIFELVNENG